MGEDDSHVAVEIGRPEESRKWWPPVLETIVATIVVALILRALTHSGAKYETNWILIAILPVLFWLFFSGRITSFKAFGVELKSAIRKISAEGIKSEQDFTLARRIDFEPVSADPKAEVKRIQEYRERRIAAIYFELKKTNYYEEHAIKKYLDALTEHRFFRWVVFQDADGRFVGLIAGRSLRTFGGLAWEGGTGYNTIRSMIERGQIDDLPGIVTAESALRDTDTKKTAIDRFSEADADDLPVIDGQGRFVGVVNRGRLLSNVTASILRAAETG
jgi:CBS domain-containing protein